MIRVSLPDDDEALFAAIMVGASGCVLQEIKCTDLPRRVLERRTQPAALASRLLGTTDDRGH